MTRIRFENAPSINTPINADNLNKLNNVAISSTEPTIGEEVWIQKGKNLFNKNNGIVSGKFFTATGELGDDSGLFYQASYIKVTPNTTYTISAAKNDYFRICRYTSDYTFIDRIIGGGTTKSNTFITPSNCNYIRVSCYYSNLDSIQIEVGSSITDYEEYIDKKVYTKNASNTYDELLNVERANNQLNYSETEQVIGAWVDGTPIYRKVINFGELPNANIKAVYHNIENIKNIIGIRGFAYTSVGDTLPLPHTHTTPTNGIYIYAGKKRVEIGTGSDRTGFNAYVILEYTKTTD